MTVIDARLEDEENSDTRYIFDDTGNYFVMRGGVIWFYSYAAQEELYLADMADFDFLIKSLSRIKSDNPITQTGGIVKS